MTENEPKKELTIEQVLEKMKKADLEYVYKEKGKKHQYRKDGATVVTFIDTLPHVSMYAYNKDTKKYDRTNLYTLKDLEDNLS